MFRFIFSLIVISVISLNSYGQDLISRVKQLEDLTTQNSKDLAQLKTDVAVIKADLAAIKAVTVKTDSKSNTIKFTVPYNAGKICDCGCLETGKCSCVNCNSPVSTRSLLVTSSNDPMIQATDGNFYPSSAWGAGTGVSACANGSCGTNTVTYGNGVTYSNDVTYSNGVMFGNSAGAGSCANGSCGSTRTGLFGRRR